jgi:hypothetical protein
MMNEDGYKTTCRFRKVKSAKNVIAASLNMAIATSRQNSTSSPSYQQHHSSLTPCSGSECLYSHYGRWPFNLLSLSLIQLQPSCMKTEYRRNHRSRMPAFEAVTLGMGTSTTQLQ